MKNLKIGFQVLNNKLEVITTSKTFKHALSIVDQLEAYNKKEGIYIASSYYIFNIKTSKTVQIL